MKYVVPMILGKILELLVLFWVIALACWILGYAGVTMIILDIAVSVALAFALDWAQKRLFGNSLGGWFFSIGISGLEDYPESKKVVAAKRVSGILVIVILTALIFF